MRVSLEIGLNAEGMRGFDYYIRGLIGGLAEADKTNDYRLFCYFWRDFAAKRERLPSPQAPNMRLAAQRWPEGLVNFLEYTAGLPLIDRLYARPQEIDVYHALGGVPRLSRARTVVTVFDFIHEQLRPGKTMSASYARTRLTMDRAARIMVPSEATKRDAARLYGLDPDKITVTWAGVDHALFKPGAKKAGLPPRYWLLVGPFEERRNAERVLEAVAGAGLPVVAMGAPNDYWPNVRAAAQRHRVELIPAGYVAREDMPAVYGGAQALLHPSLFDGLGLPNLEAMACGTPVVAGNNSGQADAVGDAGILVDPMDAGAIAAAARSLLDPATRESFSRKGLERAAKFTWRRTAELTLKVYEQAAKY